MSSFLPLFNILPTQENIKDVVKELSNTCTSCKLSFIHPLNKGLVWKGNPYAKIAVVAEAPGLLESERGIPLVGKSGQEFDRWMKYIGVNPLKDTLITNVINCMPPMVFVDGHKQQRAPDTKEINACFGPRCLRLLKSMPNLEVVVTLGWVAAKCILGGNPTSKTHEGQWFESSLLPGKAIFCLIHPSFILRKEQLGEYTASSVNKRCLELFKNEYLNNTKPIVEMSKSVNEKRAIVEQGYSEWYGL